MAIYFFIKFRVPYLICFVLFLWDFLGPSRVLAALATHSTKEVYPTSRYIKCCRAPQVLAVSESLVDLLLAILVTFAIASMKTFINSLSLLRLAFAPASALLFTQLCQTFSLNPSSLPLWALRGSVFFFRLEFLPPFCLFNYARSRLSGDRTYSFPPHFPPPFLCYSFSISLRVFLLFNNFPKVSTFFFHIFSFLYSPSTSLLFLFVVFFC